MQGDPFLDAFERRYGRSGSKQDDPFLAAFERRYGTASPSEERDEEDKKPSLWQRGVRGAKEFREQAARGLGESVTSLGDVAGVLGWEAAERAGERGEAYLAEMFGEGDSAAGRAGRFIGRAVGEIGQAALGGAGVAKGAAKLAMGGGRTAAAAKAVQAGLQSKSALTRAASTAAASAPIDVVQGLKEEEGLVLPGRFGSVAEGVLFSGTAGALGAAMDARKARLRPDGAQQGPDLPSDLNVAPPITSPATPRMAGRETPLTEPVTDADRYANIGRMTAEEPQLAEGLRETVRGAVETRELGERLEPRGKETLGRLVDTETFEDTRKRTAELLGVSPSDIVARTAQGERVGRERLLRATEELLGRQQTVNELNERLRSGMVVDAEELRRLTALRDAERQAAEDLFASISTQKTEIARDLSAARIGASLSDNPIVWKERLEELAKRTLTGDEIAEAERLASIRDINGLLRLGTELRKSTSAEKGVTLYKTSLLTGPKTFLANLFGNVGMAGVRQVRDIPATFADMALASVTGQRTKVLDVAGRWQAVSRGAMQGVDDAKKVMRGELPFASKFSEIREVNYDSALANLYTKGVFRTLDATDRVFRGMAFAESIDEQARLLARSKGLTGQAAQDFVARVTRAPTTEMTADAMLAADIATFQQDSEIARVALQARRKLGVVGDLLFPFAKTPANIAQTIVNYSPIGIAGTQFRTNLKRVLAKEATTSQQRMVAERIGEMSTGTALIMLGYLKGKNGTMTGFFPADQRTRDQWEAEGKLEGAVKMGNDWLQINRISPVGNMLTVGAALADVENGDPGVLAMAIGLVAAPLSAVTDLPMVQGLSNITEILDPQATPEQREAATTRMAGGVVSGAVPFSGLVRSVQQAIDPNVREARSEGRVESALRQVGTGIPGVAQRLPVKVDPLGRPVQRGGTAIERFASPFQRRTDITTQDPVQAALASANAVVGRTTRRKGETPEAYAERAQLTGKTVRLAVGRAIESPAYANIETMNVAKLRRALQQTDVNVEGLSDDEIRNAWRSVLLNRVIAKAKSAVSRRIPNTPPIARQLERAIERQR